MKTFLLFITCAAVLVFGGTALATTIHVPADQPTIQAGIDAASDGDTVLVADGTYSGDGNFTYGTILLDFGGKAIVVKSENGPENCIIDNIYGGGYQAFIFDKGETSESILDGFTIKNFCICIICESSPTIVNNNITNNGTGVYCEGEESFPIIKDNIITKTNFVGIYCRYGSSPLIIGNRIRDNSGGGIEILEASAVIKNNIITGNSALGGIYLERDSSVVIINNTIIGNSASGRPAKSSSDLRCEYDNNNRIYECFIDRIRPSHYGGGGIYTNSYSTEIMNNIIAFSKRDIESFGLSRWYYTDLFMRYNYEGASLKSVTYYYGFENFGDSGDVYLSGCINDTSFTIQSGERYWMETNSFVSEYGDGGGIDLTICMDNDSLQVKVDLGGYFGGCYYLYNTKLQCYTRTSGAGIMAIGDNSFPNIAYNDVYGSEGTDYLVGATSDSTYEVDLTGIDGNISQDPLCVAPDYLLSSGSPCIDAGNPDPSFNDNIRPPGMGTERCDIGAYGGPENDIITITTSVEDYTAIPSQFLLYQNYPNPFNSTTTINYSIPINGFVSIEVFDILGIKIISLVNEEKSAGLYAVLIDASELSSGIYFYRLQMNKFIATKKLLLVK